MPHFGKKVVGESEYAKAVASEKGGAQVFGVRVRGAIPADGPTNIAKRATEHGPRVTSDASFQDAEGKETDGVAIDDLRNILAENPTTFDSLYEAELAREDGARPDALAIFYEVERGIKGQGRADILDEIKGLINEKQPLSQRAALDADLRIKQVENMKARQAENVQLVDAPRIKAMQEREENLAALKEAGVDPAQSNPFVEGQLDALAGNGDTEKGHARRAGTGDSASGKVPTKPEGDVHPETQQPGERQGVPKKRARSKKRT